MGGSTRQVPIDMRYGPIRSPYFTGTAPRYRSRSISCSIQKIHAVLLDLESTRGIHHVLSGHSPSLCASARRGRRLPPAFFGLRRGVLAQRAASGLARVQRAAAHASAPSRAGGVLGGRVWAVARPSIVATLMTAAVPKETRAKETRA